MDHRQLTQVGRAMKELGIQMIPAYSPQARGRSERNFQTWQGRLPQELRLAGAQNIDQANAFLKETYIREFNQKFAVAAAQSGTAFVPLIRTDLDRVFSIQHERTVNQDNTVRWVNVMLQIQPQQWKSTLAGCRVLIYEHLNATLSIGYGPHEVGRFTPDGQPIANSETVSNPKRTKKKSALGRWGLISSNKVTSVAR